MAIAFINQVSGQSTSSVTSFASPSLSVTQNNHVVVCMVSSQNTTLAATDSVASSTYFTAVAKQNATPAESFTMQVAMVASTVGTVYTATPGVAGWVSIGVLQYSGLTGGADPRDTATNSAGPTLSTAVNPGAASPATSSALYVSCWTHSEIVAGQTFTAGGGATLRTNLNDTNNMPLGSEELIASGSQTLSATLAGSATWIAGVATFKGLAVSVTLEQEGYRWRNDDGSEMTATWKAVQDTTITGPTATTTRLRLIVNATADPASQLFKVQYRKVGAASWRNVDKFV